MNKSIEKMLLSLLFLLILLLIIPGCPDHNGEEGEPTPEPTSPPTRPVADAGDNYLWWLIGSITLDGSDSYDPNGDTLTYLWEFVSIPGTSGLTNNDITDADLVSASFTPDVRGFYTFVLTVSDGTESDTDEVVIEIANYPPFADAGDDQVTDAGVTANLDGSNSTDFDDSDTLSFAWEFVSIPAGSSLTNPDITDPDTATPSITPDIEGEFILRLTVDDGYDSDTDTVSVFGLDPGSGVITVTID